VRPLVFFLPLLCGYGEFGWGGTTVIEEHRRPKVGAAGKETTRSVQGRDSA
jgi:hypothetical protein